METLHIGLGPSRRLAAMHAFAGAMLWLSSLGDVRGEIS